MKYKVGQKFKSINTDIDAIGCIVGIRPHVGTYDLSGIVEVKWSDLSRKISYGYGEFEAAFEHGDFYFVIEVNKIWKDLNEA